MIGVITFKIKTKGKYTKDDKEEITYTSEEPASQNNIFITPTVKFAKQLSYDNDDYKSALTSYEKFKQFVNKSREKNGETTIEDKETIISNLNFNINFIKRFNIKYFYSKSEANNQRITYKKFHNYNGSWKKMY